MKITFKNAVKYIWYSISYPFSGFRFQPRTIILGDGSAHFFSGYYDLSPFSSDGVRHLALRAPFSFSPDTAGKRRIDIGYFDLAEDPKKFIQLTMTELWNWQQGCRLQWLPHSNEYIVYNTIIDNKFGSAVFSTKTKKVVTKFSRPIYSLSPDGRYALGLDFSLLNNNRKGYGYSHAVTDSPKNTPQIENCIYRIDLLSGQIKTLFNITDIERIWPVFPTEDGTSYFNHIAFNPNSSRFLFFHCFNGVKGRYTRLITSSVEGTDIYPLVNYSTVSHYTWFSEKTLYVILTYNRKTRLYSFTDQSDSHYILLDELLHEDGHPVVIHESGLEYLLIDTYPDRFRKQYLNVYNIIQKNKKFICYFKIHPQFVLDKRIDFHPKYHHDTRQISIDTCIRSRRVIAVMDSPHLKN